MDDWAIAEGEAVAAIATVGEGFADSVPVADPLGLAGGGALEAQPARAIRQAVVMADQVNHRTEVCALTMLDIRSSLRDVSERGGSVAAARQGAPDSRGRALPPGAAEASQPSRTPNSCLGGESEGDLVGGQGAGYQPFGREVDAVGPHELPPERLGKPVAKGRR
jgi:hypothetical protein